MFDLVLVFIVYQLWSKQRVSTSKWDYLESLLEWSDELSLGKYIPCQITPSNIIWDKQWRQGRPGLSGKGPRHLACWIHDHQGLSLFSPNTLRQIQSIPEKDSSGMRELSWKFPSKGMEVWKGCKLILYWQLHICSYKIDDIDDCLYFRTH